VVGHPDRVSGDLVEATEALPKEQAGRADPVNEVVLVRGGPSSEAYFVAELVAWEFDPVLAGGLVQLGVSGVARPGRHGSAPPRIDEQALVR